MSLAFAALLACAAPTSTSTPGMVVVPAGDVAPFWKNLAKNETSAAPIHVDSFALDVEPVTNAAFARFVRTHARWQRSHVNALFAERGYLASWASDVDPGAANPADAPVVEVSWFAAKAYCASVGKRVPTTFEWERAAEGDVDSTARILAWYSAPSPAVLPSVAANRANPSGASASDGASGANRFGVRDLFGVVWEWTLDFGDASIDVDQAGADAPLFCGAGAANAADPNDAATFMRWAFRSSLRASYAVRNLGLRCAKDVTK